MDCLVAPHTPSKQNSFKHTLTHPIISTPIPPSPPNKKQKVRWAGDRCCVCDSDVDYDCDRLVSCDGCGLAVHQSCYGVHELPGLDDMWLCRWVWRGRL